MSDCAVKGGCPPYDRAVAALAAKDAEIAALREAVSPLARILCLIDDKDESKGRAFDGWVENRIIFNVGKDRTITVGDLRRARAALAPRLR